VMRPGLYLHIGTHKTGTTSFQAFISEQADDLRAHGVEPWFENGGVANAWQLAHHFLREDLPTPVRLKGMEHKSEGVMERFVRHVEKSDRPAHVVSSEAFCFARTLAESEALKIELKSLFQWVRPIVVFRAASEWRRSWLMQLTKMKVTDAIEAVPEHNRVSADWYFNPAAITAFWQEIGSLTPIDYDREMARNASILPALQSAIGLSDVPIRKDYQRNVSSYRGAVDPSMR
jgi:hypothetical protein